MSQPPNRRQPRRAWRVYLARDGREIERRRRAGLPPLCPCCGEVLEAEPTSRLGRALPAGATAHDLCCRDCHRFWAVVRHSERSLRLLRMRRLVAAIRAVEPGARTRRLDPAAA
ncbi:MAG TPA: hypothetical protein VFL93_15085 [Longimicrobiaceae bacterium]|jgi:hypothetical protein|nr:hypothetical protein [Longimicrobiaceae bacterium]